MAPKMPNEPLELESDERELEVDLDGSPDLVRLHPGDLVGADGRRWRIMRQQFTETPAGELRMSVVIRTDPPDTAAEARRATAREAARQRQQRPARLEDIGDGFFVPEVRAKQLHAEELIDNLGTEVHAYLARSPYKLVQETNETLTQYSQRIVFSELPPVLRWSQQVGDILSNFEAALDYLMWHIAQVELGVDEPPQPKRIYFPICETPKSFREWQQRLPWSLSSHVADRIEQWQPYGNQSVHSSARFLNLAGNRNKHRTLLDVGLGTSRATLSSTVPPDAEPRWHNPLRRVIRDHDVMATVSLPKPTPGVSINHQYDLSLVIRPPADSTSSALGEWISLKDALTGVRQYVLFAAHEVFHDVRLGPRARQAKPFSLNAGLSTDSGARTAGRPRHRNPKR